MSKWIAEFELEDGDTMPEHMDLEYKGVKIDFHCRPLSSSGKPNMSIEEKCPCYHCEYFEIKGWSHCKIHEDAYGDSRCNDYHKVNQGSNKQEISTSSDCVSRSTVLTLINDVKNANGFSEYSQYEYLFDQVDTMPPATTQEPIRPKGKWISYHYGAYYECSNCHERNNSRYDKYCKFCGAVM